MEHSLSEPSVEVGPVTFESDRNAFQVAIMRTWLSRHEELLGGDETEVAKFVEVYSGVFRRLYEEARGTLPKQASAIPEIVNEWVKGMEAEWGRYKHQTRVV